MKNLIKKLVKGEMPTERDIQDLLYDICDDTHGSCDYNCPVFDVNGGPLNPTQQNYGCACFKNGKAMYNFIKERGMK